MIPEKVVEDGLLDRHAGLEEHGEVADLVRQFVAEDRDRGWEAGHETLGEGRTHGKAVRKVVDAVAYDDHPSWKINVG